MGERLKGKMAVVTGAGSVIPGIGNGKATAILFAREGARVMLVDYNLKAAEETKRIIDGEGGDCLAFQADVTKASDCQSMVELCIQTFGRVDILYNNAGIPQSFTAIEDTSEELWDRIMAVNLKGIFLGCKYAVPIMKKQGGGVIINTASVGGVRPRGGLDAYSASKGGAIVLSKSLAIELGPFKIRVNSISPVFAETAMWPKFLGDRDIEESRKTFTATVPLGRLARAEDVAHAALYLASDEASMINGIDLGVDGGRSV